MSNHPPVGLMRERVEVLSRSVSQDSYGGSGQAWTPLGEVWGKVEPLSGRELWQAQQVRPDVTHRVTIRHYPGLTPRHRLKLGTRVFEVQSVLNLEERGRVTECLCVEEVS